MKPLLILIVSQYCTIAAFAQETPSDTQTAGLSGKWNLIEFKNRETGEITDTTTIQNGWLTFYKKVRLNFYDNDSVGEIKGQSFCNDVGGFYKIYKNNKLSVANFGGTKVWCLYEGKLWDAFTAASSYKRTTDTLYILYNNDSDEMVFVHYN